MLGSLLRKSCVFASQKLLQDLNKCSVNSAGAAISFNRISKACQDFRHVYTATQTDKTTNLPPTGIITPSSNDITDLNNLLDSIVEDLTGPGRNEDIPEFNERFAKVLHYNVPGGKYFRGMMLYNSYRVLVKEKQLSEECKRLALTMAWCIELYGTFLLILDDVEDLGTTRRGRICWYRLDDVGNVAINDGVLVECALYEILRLHFRDKPYYTDVIDVFSRVALKTMLGQGFDLKLWDTSGKPNFQNFTRELLFAIAKYKTGYYTFCLPGAVAMYMAGINDPELHRKAENIFLEIGNYFQAQDDFFDILRAYDLIGKHGNDIQVGKCTWLLVNALERVTPEQLRILEECYGQDDPVKTNAVFDLYEELDLKSIYANYEEETYTRIKSLIQEISTDVPPEVFLSMLHTIHKRVR